MRNLLLRAATAAVGIPVVLLINDAGGFAFGVAVVAAAGLALYEFYSLLRAAGFKTAWPLGGLAGIVIPGVPLVTHSADRIWLGIIVSVIVLSAGYFLLPSVYGRNAASWALTVLPVLAVGLFLGTLSQLRVLPLGAWWVVLVLVITWTYDTGAYAAGRLVGNHPFMQHVSPNKTAEGVAGGLLLACVGALLVTRALPISWWQGLSIGFAGGVAAQLGDLAESMLKREAGWKDSGAIIPGHGGLLDRIDGMLFVSALVYYMAALYGYAT